MRSKILGLVFLSLLALCGCKPTAQVVTVDIDGQATLSIELLVKGGQWDYQKDDKSTVRCSVYNATSYTQTLLESPKKNGFELYAQGSDQRSPMDLELLDQFFLNGATGVTVAPGQRAIVFEAPLHELLKAEGATSDRFSWYVNKQKDRETPLYNLDGSAQNVQFWFVLHWNHDLIRSQPITLTLAQ